MIPLSLYPAINASLNATSALFLGAGYAFIRGGNARAHTVCMGAAALASSLFLVSYIAYHLQAGSVRFQGTGWVRDLYFAILTSHTVLAVAVLPMALRTLTLALRRQFDKHKRLARWTLPLWMYVSVTGVVIYWMLYGI